MRQQFHHVIDIAPTIYDMLDIPQPEGRERLRADADGRRQPRLHVRRRQRRGRRRTMQFFDNNASRGIYLDGWFACRVRAVHPVGHARLGQAPCQLGLRQG